MAFHPELRIALRIGVIPAKFFTALDRSHGNEIVGGVETDIGLTAMIHLPCDRDVVEIMWREQALGGAGTVAHELASRDRIKCLEHSPLQQPDIGEMRGGHDDRILGETSRSEYADFPGQDDRWLDLNADCRVSLRGGVACGDLSMESRRWRDGAAIRIPNSNPAKGLQPFPVAGQEVVADIRPVHHFRDHDFFGQ